MKLSSFAVIAMCLLMLVSTSATSTSTVYEDQKVLGDFNVSGNIFSAANLSVYDLTVRSGNSIHLGIMSIENFGHYSQVDENFMVNDSDQPTAFIGVQANNVSTSTRANLILKALDSTFNIVKNSELVPFAANSSGIINDGTHGTFVGHDDHITWWHYTTLDKDQYGNIYNLTGMQRLMMLNDTSLNLEQVGLIVSGNATADYFIGDGSQLTNIATSQMVGAGVDRIPYGSESGGLTDSSHLVYKDGNLGIGLTTPTYRLEIAGGDIRANERIIIGSLEDFLDTTTPLAVNAISGDVARFWSGTTSIVNIEVGPSTRIKYEGSNDNNSIGTHMDKPFQIVTDSLDRITILGDGRVGIGTSNPFYDFQIERNVSGIVHSMLYNPNTGGTSDYIVAAGDATNIHLMSNAGVGTYYGISPGEGGLISLYGNMLFSVGDAGDASEVMRITPTGMDVVGLVTGNGFNALKFENQLGDLKIQPDVQGDVILFGDTDVGDNESGKTLYVYRNDDYLRFYMTQSGGGLIHSNSPISIQTSENIVLNSVGENVRLSMGDDLGVKKVDFRNKNGDTVATIDSLGNSYFAGNVGIGTLSPSVELDVNGTLNVDTINEYTGSAGVIIEGIKFKDSNAYIDSSNYLFLRDDESVSVASELDGHLDLNADLVMDVNAQETRFHGEVQFSQSEVTITSGGAITVSDSNHKIDTYEDNATDNLDTINGGQPGQILFLRTVDNNRDVTIRDEVGNIKLAGGNDFVMDTRYDNIMLIYDTVGGGLWMEIERSNID